MTEIATTSRDNPEFARVIAVSQLRGLDAFPFDLAPTPDEAAAIARLLDARGLRKMRFSGRLLPEAAGGWRLEADLGASVTQTCVITLEPVVSRIDLPVTRRFVPDLGAEGMTATSRDDDDEIDPLGDRLDLGRVALEALALALPDYPRKPGAALGTLAAGPVGPTGSAEAEVRPFAALAALRGKVDGAG